MSHTQYTTPKKKSHGQTPITPLGFRTRVFEARSQAKGARDEIKERIFYDHLDRSYDDLTTQDSESDTARFSMNEAERFLDALKWFVFGCTSHNLDDPLMKFDLFNLKDDSDNLREAIKDLIECDDYNDNGFISAFAYVLSENNNDSVEQVRSYLENVLATEDVDANNVNKIIRLSSSRILSNDSILSLFDKSEIAFCGTAYAKMMNAAFENLRLSLGQKSSVEAEVKLLRSIWNKSLDNIKGKEQWRTFFESLNMQSIISNQTDALVQPFQDLAFSDHILNKFLQHWEVSSDEHHFDKIREIAGELSGRPFLVDLKKFLKEGLESARTNRAAFLRWVPCIRVQSDSNVFRFTKEQEKAIVLSLQTRGWEYVRYLSEDTREWFMSHVKDLIKENPAIDISAFKETPQFSELLELRSTANNQTLRDFSAACIFAALIFSGVHVGLVGAILASGLIVSAMVSVWRPKVELSFMDESQKPGLWKSFLTECRSLMTPYNFSKYRNKAIVASVLVARVLFPFAFAHMSFPVLVAFLVPFLAVRLYFKSPQSICNDNAYTPVKCEHSSEIRSKLSMDSLNPLGLHIEHLIQPGDLNDKDDLNPAKKLDFS